MLHQVQRLFSIDDIGDKDGLNGKKQACSKPVMTNFGIGLKSNPSW
jgi:hypothetical protein